MVADHPTAPPRSGTAVGFGIGVQGHPLPSAGRITLAQLEALPPLGVTVVGVRMTQSERRDADRWAARLARRTAQAGLRLAHLAGPQERLLAHGRAERRAAVRTVASGLRAAELSGAERLLVGPGGFSPRGPWWYHPRNFAPASRKALVESLRELGDAAGTIGVGLVLEGYQGSAIESVGVMADIAEQVDSPALALNLDYVNFLTPAGCARFPETLRDMAATLGARLGSIHVKDAVVWPRLSSHVDECEAGRGDLDLRLVIELARRADVPALVEHLRAAHAEAAIRHVSRLAQR